MNLSGAFAILQKFENMLHNWSIYSSIMLDNAFVAILFDQVRQQMMVWKSSRILILFPRHFLQNIILNVHCRCYPLVSLLQPTVVLLRVRDFKILSQSHIGVEISTANSARVWCDQTPTSEVNPLLHSHVGILSRI